MAIKSFHQVERHRCPKGKGHFENTRAPSATATQVANSDRATPRIHPDINIIPDSFLIPSNLNV